MIDNNLHCASLVLVLCVSFVAVPFVVAVVLNSMVELRMKTKSAVGIALNGCELAIALPVELVREPLDECGQ